MRIKNLFIIGVIASLGFLSCEKDPIPTGTNSNTGYEIGTITQQDFRKCACCGGWFVDVGDSTYRFYEIPTSSGIKMEDEKMPLDVYIEFMQEPERCMPDLIIVNRIKKL
ncbi:MAG: hypothetical protein ACI9JN_001923 [Bacteroidia bacterium]|jgi:hypothetical protein